MSQKPEIDALSQAASGPVQQKEPASRWTRLVFVLASLIMLVLAGFIIQKANTQLSTPQVLDKPGSAPKFKTTVNLNTNSKPLLIKPSTSTADLQTRQLSPELRDTVSQPETMAVPVDASVLSQSQPSDTQQLNALESKLQPFRLQGVKAKVLANRQFMVTQGTIIDCVLDTRLISTQPGLCLCHLTHDVYSADGRVVLLDKGSKVTGLYQNSPVQGQNRIFVQWSRIETPHGVIIDVDSPATGSLGEAGLGGIVETHFWARFGGALLLSLVDGAVNTAAQRHQASTQIQIAASTPRAAQDMAAEALRHSIGIPPTLYKQPGERVAILVARDLDFRDVYALQRR